MKSLSDNEKAELLNEYIVVENNLTEELGILKRDSFETLSASDCFGKHGQPLDDFDESCSSECVVYNWHDGHNWQSIIIESDDSFETHTELSKSEQLSILSKFNEIDLHIDSASETKITEGYSFIITRYQSDPFLATVLRTF